MFSRTFFVFMVCWSLLGLAQASPKPAPADLPGTAAFYRVRFKPGQSVPLNISHVHTLLMDGHYCLILYTYDSKADVDGGTALAYVSPEQVQTYSAKYGTRRIRRRAASGSRDLGVTTQTLHAILDRNTTDALYVRLP